MYYRKVFHLLAAFAAVTIGMTIAVAAESEKTVLDGAYTEAQAARGATAYYKNCAGCHGENLGGNGAAPILLSSEFLDQWREDYLSSLFQFIQTRMPQSPPGPGGLPQSQYLDITAFILSRNDFPAGSSELSAADLDTTFLVGLDGPKPMPPNATVRAVGCLAHSGDVWSLTKSAPPARVRKGDETDAAELEKSSHAALGTLQFRLPNLEDDFQPADVTPQVSKKVQVKGVLNGDGAAGRIFVLSFKGLGQDCGS